MKILHLRLENFRGVRELDIELGGKDADIFGANGKGNPDAKGVNMKLCTLGLITKPDKKNWRLTPEGRKYGEEKPYTRGGHSGYQIVWSDKVFDVLGIA